MEGKEEKVTLKKKKNHLLKLRMEAILALCKRLQETCILLNKEGRKKYQHDQRYGKTEQIPFFFPVFENYG